MRDLVESVIDTILVRERMQQQAQRPHQSGTALRPARGSSPTQTQMHATGAQISHTSRHRDEKLWQASLQFESIFIQQMMAAMRKTVPKSEFMQQGFAEDVHGSMMDEAIAQASAKQSSLGIAESLYRQLEATQGVNTQGISNTADNLNMTSGLLMEVNKHAH